MHKGHVIALLTLAGAAAVAARPEQPATQSRPAPPSPAAILKSLGEEHHSYFETLSGGRIDWTRGEILAEGQGRVRGSSAEAVAMARRAAGIVAARNAVLLIAGLRVDPEGRRPDIQSGRISVEAVVKQYEQTSFEYDPLARNVKVTLRVPIYGVRGVVRLTGVVTARRTEKWPWPEGKPAAEPIDLVVIDARGTQFTPVMFPQVQTLTGQRVFDSGDVAKDALLSRAMVIYAARGKPADEPATQPASRPAARLLVLRAASSKGKPSGTLVLSGEELKKLAEHPEAQERMKAGKVVVLAGDGT